MPPLLEAQRPRGVPVPRVVGAPSDGGAGTPPPVRVATERLVGEEAKVQRRSDRDAQRQAELAAAARAARTARADRHGKDALVALAAVAGHVFCALRPIRHGHLAHA